MANHYHVCGRRRAEIAADVGINLSTIDSWRKSEQPNPIAILVLILRLVKIANRPDETPGALEEVLLTDYPFNLRKVCNDQNASIGASAAHPGKIGPGMF